MASEFQRAGELQRVGGHKRVHLVSLGCAKNRVDSEVMAGRLRADSWEMVDDPARADVIVVNTCSFIQPATEESIETILEMAGHKTAGSCETLVVTGCMVQRYGASLEGELPEVDHFLGTGEYHRIDSILRQGSSAPKSHVDVPLYIHDELAPRLNSWAPHSAYLKISEGCNHRCAFCIIPTLRGKLRSRTIPSLVEEAKTLAASGVRELNLVSQDSTAYGRDLGDGTNLGDLVRGLAGVDGLEWIRLHYLYPHGVPQGLLAAVAEEPKVCNYIDIPLQHASGPMLRAMKRGVTRAGQERILDRIRAHVPDVTLRTTFIVGFPGETEEDFEELVDFVKAQRFHRVGVFPYSQEDGTAAAELPHQVPEALRHERVQALLDVQAEISRERMEALVDTDQDVIIDGPSKEHDWVWCGRMRSQAPDVDGQVFLEGDLTGVKPGDIRKVRILRSADYDCVGRIADA